MTPTPLRVHPTHRVKAPRSPKTAEGFAENLAYFRKKPSRARLAEGIIEALEAERPVFVGIDHTGSLDIPLLRDLAKRGAFVLEDGNNNYKVVGPAMLRKMVIGALEEGRTCLKLEVPLERRGGGDRDPLYHVSLLLEACENIMEEDVLELYVDGIYSVTLKLLETEGEGA